MSQNKRNYKILSFVYSRRKSVGNTRLILKKVSGLEVQLKREKCDRKRAKAKNARRKNVAQEKPVPVPVAVPAPAPAPKPAPVPALATRRFQAANAFLSSLPFLIPGFLIFLALVEKWHFAICGPVESDFGGGLYHDESYFPRTIYLNLPISFL